MPAAKKSTAKSKVKVKDLKPRRNPRAGFGDGSVKLTAKGLTASAGSKVQSLGAFSSKIH